MKLIDADAIPYVTLYRDNWLKGEGRDELAAWKSSIDKMPRVTIEGYDLNTLLALVETMKRNNITPDGMVGLMLDAGRMAERLHKEFDEAYRRAFEKSMADWFEKMKEVTKGEAD